MQVHLLRSRYHNSAPLDRGYIIFDNYFTIIMPSVDRYLCLHRRDITFLLRKGACTISIWRFYETFLFDIERFRFLPPSIEEFIDVERFRFAEALNVARTNQKFLRIDENKTYDDVHVRKEKAFLPRSVRICQYVSFC